MADVEITQVTVSLQRRRLPDMVEQFAKRGIPLSLPTLLDQADATRYCGPVVVHFHNGVPAKIEIPTSVQARATK